MALNLNLFVHGVPSLGQEIWGPVNSDRVLLENFYGKRTNIEAQLQVDIFQIDGNLNCYYTYLRGCNVISRGGREGSYFALTVKINAYYTDLFNMYNILDVIYQKMILRTILNSDVSASRYIVNDFNQVDEQLIKIEEEVKKYLSSFSITSDFINLNEGFASNSQFEAAKINLLECNHRNILNHIKEKGNISVSPFYPSMQTAEQIRRKDEEINNMNLQMQQKIAEEKNKSEQEKQLIKQEYASAASTIAELNKELETAKKNVFNLKSELDRNNNKLNEYNILKQKLTSREEEFNKSTQILSIIKKSLDGFNGNNVATAKNKPSDIVHAKSNIEKFNIYLLFTNFIFTFFIFLFLLYLICKSKHL
jgi:hypothetical protein